MTTSPHRYTHPASPPSSDEAALVEVRANAVLAGYGLTLDQAVEVELLVASPHNAGGGRLVEGTITGATEAALMLEGKGHKRPTRVPWAAVALVRDAYTDHPAI